MRLFAAPRTCSQQLLPPVRIPHQDMMHLACWSKISYSTLWLIQTFLPLLYFATCFFRIAFAYMLYQMTLHRLPPTGFLMSQGWRPRRSFTLGGFRDSYAPAAVLYMHMYYITGVSKCIEMLSCDGAPGEQYLVASPALRCWEGEHAYLVGLNIVAICIYFVLTPFMYVHVLFHLVPKYGRHHPRVFSNFGFIYNRFEARVYWWEMVEMIRKVGLVLVLIFAPSAEAQSMGGLLCVSVVLLGHFYYRKWRPYR